MRVIKILWLFFLLISTSLYSGENIQKTERATLKPTMAYIALSAISTIALLKAIASFSIVPAPWLKPFQRDEIKQFGAGKKIFYPHNRESASEHLIVFIPGNASYYQNIKDNLQHIVNQTGHRLMALNYDKIFFSSDALVSHMFDHIKEEAQATPSMPYRITLIGHSLGAGVASHLAGKLHQQLDIEKGNIHIIAFNSFEAMHKVANVPKQLPSLLSWELDPIGSYKTSVIFNPEDGMMKGNHRQSKLGGNTINVFSFNKGVDRHTDWSAINKKTMSNVSDIIIDIINEDDSRHF